MVVELVLYRIAEIEMVVVVVENCAWCAYFPCLYRHVHVVCCRALVEKVVALVVVVTLVGTHIGLAPVVDWV